MERRYEVDTDLTVRVWDERNEAPFLLQPTWPNGTPFADVAEAAAFAQTVIAHHETPEIVGFPMTPADLITP